MAKKTLSELGIHSFFYYKPGEYNAITDLDGVKVGHTTLMEGQDVRTGVTVIIPTDFSQNRLLEGGYAFNANGELMGLQYALEEGRLSSPIFLTNTDSMGDVYSAALDYYGEKIGVGIVGECYDGYLNDTSGRHVKKEHVVAAIENAASGPVAQGNVGGRDGNDFFWVQSWNWHFFPEIQNTGQRLYRWGARQ